VREYLEGLDEEALAETLPKRLSLTDPQARWTAAPGDQAFFASSTNYLIDTEHGVIMAVEPTLVHRTAEVESTKTMIDRVEAQFDIKPERLIGDTAYGTAPMLAWMVEEKDIEPHVPVWNKTERKNDSFSTNDFHWNEEAEESAARPATHCAANGEPSRMSVHTSPKPTPSSYDPGRPTALRVRSKPCAARTPRSARSLAASMKPLAMWLGALQQRRGKKVAMLFAHLKCILKLDRLRLRGMSRATDEFALAAAVQNLRRLAKFSSQGPPITG